MTEGIARSEGIAGRSEGIAGRSEGIAGREEREGRKQWDDGQQRTGTRRKRDGRKPREERNGCGGRATHQSRVKKLDKERASQPEPMGRGRKRGEDRRNPARPVLCDRLKREKTEGIQQGLCCAID